MSLEVIYYPNGTTQTVTHPDPPAITAVLDPSSVLNLLPASVVKAIKESAAAAVVKRYEMFKLKATWTKTEGAALFDDIQAAGLMTAQQNTDALAAWP